MKASTLGVPKSGQGYAAKLDRPSRVAAPGPAQSSGDSASRSSVGGRADARRSMRRSRSSALLALGALLLAGIALGGCGGGGSNASTTTASNGGTATVSKSSAHKHVPTVEKVEISSPVIAPAGEIPTRYTCYGANVSPPLRIKGIPAGTQELALDLIKVAPVNNELLFGWALGGLSPSLRAIPSGKLPAGAIVGLNSEKQARYNLCPPKGTKEEYVFVLFALPRALHPKAGFDATSVRIESLRDAQYEGFLVFTYTAH